MKKIISSLAIACIAMVSFAQEIVNEVVVTNKNNVAINSFGSNWFIDVNVGAQAALPVTTRGEGLFDHITPAVSAHVGKWHTPGLGWRIGYNGYSVKPNKHSSDCSYYNVHIDALFNLHNLICGYKENRIWNAIPYVGFGYGANIDIPGANNKRNAGSTIANYGMLNTFRVASRWAINLELGAQMAKKDFLQETSNYHANGYDYIFHATVGVTYHIGKCNWDKTPDLDAIMALNAEALAEINRQLQTKEAENSQLKSQLEAAKKALLEAQKNIE